MTETARGHGSDSFEADAGSDTSKYALLTAYESANIVHHLASADQSEALVKLLTDIEFYELATVRGTTVELLTDATRALETALGGAAPDDHAAVAEFVDFYRSEADSVADHPELLLQQAANRRDSPAVSASSVDVLASRAGRSRWLRLVHTSADDDLRVLTVQVPNDARGWPTWVMWGGWRSVDRAMAMDIGGGWQVLEVSSRRRVEEGAVSSLRQILALDPACATVAGVADEGLVVVDMRTGDVVATHPNADEDERWSVAAFSPDSSRLAFAASGVSDRPDAVWTVATGAIVELAGTSGGSFLAWSPDGSRIVCGSNLPTVHDASSGERLGSLGDASWTTEGNVTRWEVRRGHEAGVNACSWSPDGRWIATGSGHGFGAADDDFSVRVWDAASLEEVAVLRGHRDRVTAFAWSPDSGTLASASGSVLTPGQDNSLRCWDVESRSLRATFAGHRSEVVGCSWSPDGSRICSWGKDGSIIVWRPGERSKEEARGEPLAVSAGGRHAALAREAVVDIVDCATGELVSRCRGHEDDVRVCAWAPDGLFLATGSLDRTLRVWHAASGRTVAVLAGHEDHGETYTAGGHRVVWGAVADCDWSPGGVDLVSAASDRLLIVWDAFAGEPLRRLQGHIGPVVACGWSDDGRHVVSRGGTFEHIVDGTIRLWDAWRGAELGELAPESDEARVLARRAAANAAKQGALGGEVVSPDLAWSAASEGETRRERVVVRGRATGERRTLPIGSAPLVKLAWFPSNRHLAVATDELVVFDVRDETPLLRCPLRGVASQLFVVNEGTGLLVGDQQGQHRIFALEGVDARGDPGTPTGSPAVEPEDDLRPLQPDDPTAWLRLIWGLLVNPDGSSEVEVLGAFQALVAREPAEGLFTALIDDPHMPSAPALNAELWHLGALYLWPEPEIAERCLRTAVGHDADRVDAWALLGVLLERRGENGKAERCFARCDAETVRSARETAASLPACAITTPGSKEAVRRASRPAPQYGSA